MIEEICFNRSKEANYEIVERFKKTYKRSPKDVTDMLYYLGYEISMKIKILKDGTTKILEVNGIEIKEEINL
jgi:hypothetical protein